MMASVKSRLNSGSTLEHLLKELLIPPNKRTRESIEILKQTTSSIPFFMEISTHIKYTSKQVHERLCQRMLHVHYKRGTAPIVKSSFAVINRRHRRPILHHIKRSSCHIQNERR